MDQNYCVAHWQNVVLLDIVGDMDADRMRDLERSFRVILRSYPQGFVVIALARPGVPMSSAASQAESRRIARGLGNTLVHVSVVLEAQGMIAQLARSVMRSINVVTRSTRTTIARNVDDAIQNALPHIPSALPRAQTEAELREAIASMRETFAASLKLPSDRALHRS